MSTVIPTTGSTVSFSNSAIDQVLVISPAADLAALTINFPSDVSSRIGQTVTFTSLKNVTTLTLSASAGTIYNPIGTLNVGDSYTFQKTAANTWVRK